ncbi:hypothetical protein GCM10012275_10590 [Longimycelium tulufanense]|uniref:Bacterial transcriptional activator domain-containing protein n=1 Tax=Longimycelium tulufanense TaxID=907463 RepID=A0A8J3CCZ6_9PSEU|nr:BTAD domain-containing putative transcriptional regulator [Longimycelium tulufanense]GGM41469.1 hypothetical protein GCM10012275_10590 [Longimycelium tulufanense]
MRFEVLGSFRFLSDRGEAELGPNQRRLVFATLVLHMNKPVQIGSIAHVLWGDDVPESAAGNVQAHVSRIRSQLRRIPTTDVELRTMGRSYVLRGSPDQVDAHEFRRLAAEAAARNGDRAIERYDRALALWRGTSALADLTPERSRELLVRPLEELRLHVLEARNELMLSSGGHQELIPELTSLVGHHPGRTRTTAQLMLALHRSGRTVEALAIYRSARESIVSTHGLEPARGLAELHDRILRDDPALQLAVV